VRPGNGREEGAVLIHAVPEDMAYDGSQLRSHFAFDTFGIRGDSLVLFCGGMEIPPANVVDLADLRAGEAIRGSRLLHVIVEHFGISLETAVLRQRLLVRLAADLARPAAPGLRVDGDDIYIGEGKLSVSIAAPSPVSCLIHLGLNITKAGVPVAAAALEDLGLDAAGLGGELARAYAAEIESIRDAASKVRGVD
jgi:hypothetical protein